MMWPILCRVSPTALGRLFTGRKIWYHLAFSLFVNWIFAPLLMVGLSWAFLPDKQELREGLILVGIARCIAMVSNQSGSAICYGWMLMPCLLGARLDRHRSRRL